MYEAAVTVTNQCKAVTSMHAPMSSICYLLILSCQQTKIGLVMLSQWYKCNKIDAFMI